MILMEPRNVLVIGVIAICDWFASVCFLSCAVCIADIMSHDAYCITCFAIGFIAFENEINGIYHAYSPSSSLGDLSQMDMSEQ